MLTFALTTMLLSGFTSGGGAGGASPLTTKGDVYTYSTADDRLPVGANGLCLQTDSATSTGLKWGSCGGGTPFNTTEQSVVLNNGAGVYSTVVTGLTWVTAGTTRVSCTPFGTTADGLTVEAVIAAQLEVTVSDYVTSTGFTIWIHSPHGLEGTVRVHCVGG